MTTFGMKALAAAIVLLGGAYAVFNLTGNRSTNSIENTHAPGYEATDIRVRKVDAPRQTGQASTGRQQSAGGSVLTTKALEVKGRPDPAHRVAALADDLVSTRPELVILDGETSGRIYFNLEVVNESGLPVSGATIKMTGLRTRVESASWYGWRGKPVEEITNNEGLARVSAPQVTSEKLESGAVTFNVSHPDYASADVDVAFDKITKIVLKAGWNFPLVVSDEQSSRPLKAGLTIEFSGRFPPDWSQQGDGTINVRSISGNDLNFYVKHKAESGAVALSEYKMLKFPRASKEPVYVTVYGTYSVNGSLSDNVPRPVENGKVVALHTSGDRNCGQYARQEVDIAKDGTFALNELPAGEIQIWALADGWCSVVPKDDTLRGMPQTMGKPQTFQLTENNQQYILPMNATATAIFNLVAPNGNPVPGAVLYTNPNMCYEGCCGLWIRSLEFSTTSTAEGVAVLPDLPPLSSARFSVHGEFELPPRARDGFGTSDRFDRSVTFDLVPGQVLEQTLTVFPKGTSVITQEGDKMTTSSGSN